MEKEKLSRWIERLNKAEKKDRGAILGEMAKENNLKLADVYKLLKEAGFDPEAEKQNGQGGKAESKKFSVVLRHNTESPRYRRVGLILTQRAETYEVTEKQLAALKKDPWVVIVEDKKDGAEK